MKKRKNKILKKIILDYRNHIFLFLRYLLLLLLVISLLPVIYNIFFKLTFFPVVYILKLFFNDLIYMNNIILINQISAIKIIPACIAGSAYLLLIILNLSVKMDLKKRIYSLVFSFLCLLLVNILRLIIFSVIYVKNKNLFFFSHLFIWYFLSTFFVVAIWFLTAKIFKIKEIPIYSDIIYLLKRS